MSPLRRELENVGKISALNALKECELVWGSDGIVK